MGKLLTKKILLAILVVLIAIAGSLTWIIRDRQMHNAQEQAEQDDELAFKAKMLGETVEELKADEKKNPSHDVLMPSR